VLTRNCLRSDETNARNPGRSEAGARGGLSATLDGTVQLADCWKKKINELTRSSNKTSIICVGVAQFVTQDFVRLIRTRPTNAIDLCVRRRRGNRYRGSRPAAKNEIRIEESRIPESNRTRVCLSDLPRHPVDVFVTKITLQRVIDR